jgi:acyl carrier protein
MTQPAIVDRVRAIVVAACRGDVTLEADTPFLAAGYIDSFAIIQMVGTLEDTFGIAIDAQELTQENFATIAAITALVERSGAALSPAPSRTG